MVKLKDDINDLFGKINLKLENENSIKAEFFTGVENLIKGVNAIDEFAHSYNLNTETIGNGYLSLLKMIYKFAQFTFDAANNRNYNAVNTDLLNILNFLLLMCDLAKRIHIFNSEEENLKSRAKNVKLFLYLRHFFTDDQTKSLVSLYGNYAAFWLCTSMRRTMTSYLTLLAIYSSKSTSSRVNCIWNAKNRAKSVILVLKNMNVKFLKSFWSIADYSILRDSLPNLILRQRPKLQKDILVCKRQTRYRLTKEGSLVINDDASLSIKKEIRCRLLWDFKNIEASDKNLILHCHGGGFISQSPESHEVYLRLWSKQLTNIPIISVDYSLSPESKFPTALQELLDVYLWCSDEKNEEIYNILGYYPRNILVCGDSAGGNLSLSLTLVLNDIRNRLKENVVMPMRVLCIYTPFSLTCGLTASALFATCEPLIPCGILLSCMESYVDMNDKIGSDNDLEDFRFSSDESTATSTDEIICVNKINSRNDDNILSLPNERLSKASTPGECCDDMDMDNQLFECTKLHFIEQKSIEEDFDTDDLTKDFVMIDSPERTKEVSSVSLNVDQSADISESNVATSRWFAALQRIKQIIYGLTSRPVIENLEDVQRQAWYDFEYRRYSKLHKLCSTPYITPLSYNYFDEITDVPLNLISPEFDIFLDDNVAMARKWRSAVKLNIVESMSHGFLSFIMFSDEARKGNDLCIKVIKDAFDEINEFNGF